MQPVPRETSKPALTDTQATILHDVLGGRSVWRGVRREGGARWRCLQRMMEAGWIIDLSGGWWQVTEDGECALRNHVQRRKRRGKL